MENASKALIIAGAILLSILIIAIGMYIYNSSTNSITNAASQISQQDIQAFNNQFTMYEGRQVGTNVKALITTIASICKENIDEATRLPDLVCNPKGGDTDITIATIVGGKAGNAVKATSGELKIQTELNKVRTKIESRHYYNIVFNTCPVTGLIDMVLIEYEAGDIWDSAGTTEMPEGNDHEAET